MPPGRLAGGHFVATALALNTTPTTTTTVESQWAEHSDWLERGKEAVRELWEEYRKMPVEQDQG